jgi:hypothetical protein
LKANAVKRISVLLILCLGTTCPLVVMACGACARGPGFWARRGTIDVVQFSPLERLVAVGGRDVGTEAFDDHGDVKLYASADGQLVQQIALDHRVSDLTFDAEGRLLAIATRVCKEFPYRDALAVFRIAGNDKPSKIFEVADMPPNTGFAFSPDSRFLITYGREGARVWSTDRWKPKLTVHGRIVGAEFSADSRFLAMVRLEPSRSTEVWDLTQQKKIAEMSCQSTLQLDSFGKWWIYFDATRSAIVFWDVARRAEDFVLDAPVSRCVALATSKDGKLAAIVAETRQSILGPIKTRQLWVWDISTRALLHKSIPLGPYARALGFLNEGEVVVVAEGRGPRLLETKSGHVIKKLPFKKGRHVALGKGRLATSTNESIAIWNIEGTSVTLSWEDQWRQHPWSWLE